MWIYITQIIQDINLLFNIELKFKYVKYSWIFGVL
jgi:hypothetical protein